MKINESALECIEKKYLAPNVIMFRIVKMPRKVKCLFNVLSYFIEEYMLLILLPRVYSPEWALASLTFLRVS
jgi:hypothetical protein